MEKTRWTRVVIEVVRWQTFRAGEELRRVKVIKKRLR